MKHIISIIACLLLFISCDPLKPGYKDCEVDGHTNYLFNLPFYYTPTKDTFQLGDTLWIESTFGNQLLNENNSKSYTLDNFNFGFVGGIQDLSTNPTIGYGGAIMLDTLMGIDSINGNSSYFNVIFKYDTDTYYWKRGIVLNKAGAFYTSFYSRLNLGNLSKTGQSITKCPNEYVDVRDKRMNGSNNYYLVETSPDPYIKQGKEVFENSFIFYVKE